MRLSLLCSVASILLATSAFAQSEGEFPATLAEHAVMPAESFIDTPADAPNDLKTSGKYTTGKRVDAIGTVMGKSYERSDRRVAAIQGPAAARPFRHQGDARRLVLGDHR
ncbi:hypothetical protein ACVWW1_007847 [Bradyrhizobium sp. JR3.5]